MSVDSQRKIMAGSRFRRLRNELGLSQSAMAGELGISVSYLNLVERNQRPVTAQLLIKLSETYDIDPRTFAQDEDLRASSELEEILADQMFQLGPVPRQEVKAVVNEAPAVGQALKKLYRAFLELRDLSEGKAGRASDSEREGAAQHDQVEHMREFIQQADNHFPEMEEQAEAIADELAEDDSHFLTAVSRRLSDRHKIRVQVLPVHVMGKTLRRFDFHRRKLLLSELLEPSGRAFQAAFQLALLERGALLDSLAAGAAQREEGRKLARIMLANYFAAALMMPYQRFYEAAEALAYDVEVLAARFSASYEQVAHRLTTLARPNARGVPFFMIRIDNAGNVSKRFSSGNFPFSRFGGTCPRWNIHATFRNPGRIETQLVELPDGSRWFSIARTVQHMATPWGEEAAQFVVGLGCDIKHAKRLVYARGFDLKDQAATPIGVNCRLCERANCAQRAAPPLLRPLDMNENIRGFSPFDRDLSH